MIPALLLCHLLLEASPAQQANEREASTRPRKEETGRVLLTGGGVVYIDSPEESAIKYRRMREFNKVSKYKTNNTKINFITVC